MIGRVFMKILLCSHVFAPNVGGIETVSKVLAEQFCRLGSSVTVVTSTPGEEVSPAYKTVRRPSLRKLGQLGRDADVILQNHISLRTLIPLLLCRKPVVVVHQVWLGRLSGKRGWQDYLKLWLLRLCHNLAISEAIAET